MEIQVAQELIRKGVAKGASRQVWADLGAGEGLFTEALAKLLPAESVIYAVDKDAGALAAIPDRVGEVSIRKIAKDFTGGLLVPANLDGMMMANSLHFVKDPAAFLRKVKMYLKEGGNLLLVEYDRETATQWVPYPVGFEKLAQLRSAAAFSSLVKLGAVPSVFGKVNIYSALLR